MPIGKQTSLFQPLVTFLSAQEQDEVTLTFKEIAALIGRRSIPETAILHNSWWRNARNGPVQLWRAAGWEALPDRDNLRVRFTRLAPEPR